MSSNAANSVNTSAMERRLKPIYDCLDNGCNRKAVQEADRLLKKIKDLNCAKALKSLALLRLSKDQAANEILDEISTRQPLDEITLQTMTVCYRESGQFDKIVDIYDASCRNDPTNEELLAHLFMAHVRTGNFVKQTEIARSLYKHHPKRPYYFWAIMSLVMQAREASLKFSSESSGDLSSIESMKKSAKVCLQLAENMCKKMISDEKNHEEVEIEIYLLILHKLEKFEEEYRLMTGPLCQRNYDHLGQLARRRAYLCLDLKMYSRALKHYFPSLIQEYPDQLEYYQDLFKCAFILDAEQQQSSGQSDNTSPVASAVKSTSSLCDCFELVEKQCLMALDGGSDTSSGPVTAKTAKRQQVLSRSSSHQSKHLIRGPFIARIELYSMIQSQIDKLPVAVSSQINSMYMSKYPSIRILLVDCFLLFSRKITCYYDMEYTISKCNLPRNELDLLFDEIQKSIAEPPTAEKKEFDNFYTNIRHSFYDYQPSSDRMARVEILRECLNKYDHHIQLGSQFTRTEFLIMIVYWV